MLLWRRRRERLPAPLPAARRLWPTVAEAQEIRRSFVLEHTDGTLEMALTFGDGRPAYAAEIDRDLARLLRPELERCMTAIEPLLAEDVRTD